MKKLISALTAIVVVTTSFSLPAAAASKKPGTVKKISSKKSINKATIKWKKVKKAKKYEIKFCTNKSMKGAKTLKTKKNKIQIKKLSANTKYYIKVRAVKSKYKGKWSKVYSFRTNKYNSSNAAGNTDEIFSNTDNNSDNQPDITGEDKIQDNNVDDVISEPVTSDKINEYFERLTELRDQLAAKIDNNGNGNYREWVEEDGVDKCDGVRIVHGVLCSGIIEVTNLVPGRLIYTGPWWKRNVDLLDEINGTINNPDSVSDWSDYVWEVSLEYVYNVINDKLTDMTIYIDEPLSITYSDNEILCNWLKTNAASDENDVFGITPEMTELEKTERIVKYVRAIAHEHYGRAPDETHSWGRGCIIESAYTVLCTDYEKRGVCMNYANTVAVLCNWYGIYVETCTSAMANHMWNRFWINNQWYYADPTNYYDVSDYNPFEPQITDVEHVPIVLS